MMQMTDDRTGEKVVGVTYWMHYYSATRCLL